MINESAYANYGVIETNPQVGGYKVNPDRETLCASDLAEQGGKFSRIRLLTDRGCPFLDVSYILGTLPDGTEVRVALTFDCFLARRTYRSQLQEALVRDEGLTKADCNRMGIWKEETYSIMYG